MFYQSYFNSVTKELKNGNEKPITEILETANKNAKKFSEARTSQFDKKIPVLQVLD